MTAFHLATIPRVETIRSSEFQAEYLNPLRPVILTKLATSWPALYKWTPEFFKTSYGHKQVKVYSASFAKPGKTYMSNERVLSLKSYLNVILNSSEDLRMFLYNIKSEIPELLNDIQFPSLASGFSRNFVFMFFGCRGSVTQMHFDIDMAHVFHTPILGKRTITIFPYDQARNLYRHPFTCRSYVDVNDPDFESFPRLRQAQGYRVGLLPGETLFMPGGYWHHVVYDEPGYAVSLRCAQSSPSAKLHGYFNLFIMSPIDRLMNKLSPELWFHWKEQRAISAI